MPATARNIRSQDQWLAVAQDIANRITRGPGSTHARVLYLRDLLMSIAAENYEAGRKEAQAEVDTMPKMDDPDLRPAKDGSLASGHLHMNSNAPPIIEA